MNESFSVQFPCSIWQKIIIGWRTPHWGLRTPLREILDPSLLYFPKTAIPIDVSKSPKFLKFLEGALVSESVMVRENLPRCN